MLTELSNKGGRLCEQAREGRLRCPLIVRPTSEDVITGHLVQSLRAINPRWWLPDLLNAALGTRRFRSQVYRGLQVGSWVNKPPYPRELLPWAEGSTQVDIQITWENPPTTVFIEAKYGSGLSEAVSNSRGEHGYPTDQLIRNIRVGLHEAGYLDGSVSLFRRDRRDFTAILLAPRKGHELVRRYGDAERLRSFIPHGHLIDELPRGPFVGEADYVDIRNVLVAHRCWMTRPEVVLADQLVAYLDHKQATMPTWGTNEARHISQATFLHRDSSTSICP
jgi:hypothetical protein